MMVSTRHYQSREVHGPQPNSVGLIARGPSRNPPDKLLIERRRKEDQLAAAAELERQQQVTDLRNDWQRTTDRKLQANSVKRRVDSLMKANEYALELRRERLRELLQRDEETFQMEVPSKEQTQLERQAEMRERAKQLKEKHEAERQAFVQDKLEQQFREQCEELRSTFSRRQLDDVEAERADQLRLKQERERLQRTEDEIFAKLWQADIDAKALREQQDHGKQKSANRETAAFLQQQMAALAARREEEKQLVEEEARLLLEQEELQKMEALQAAEEKRRKQQEVRQMYDQSVRNKRLQEAREMQEQLAFDRQMLEKLLEESRIEAADQAQKKIAARAEDQRYREYLRQIKEEERRHELELDRLCDVEVEKAWQKRLAQWRVERLARQKLLEEVLESRKQQLLYKLRENEVQREEARRDRETLLATIEENHRAEQERVDRVHRTNQAHRDDLLGQMAYNDTLRREERDEERREWQRAIDEGAEYRAKVLDLASRPAIDKVHPMRRRLYNQPGHKSASGFGSAMF